MPFVVAFVLRLCIWVGRGVPSAPCGGGAGLSRPVSSRSRFSPALVSNDGQIVSHFELLDKNICFVQPCGTD